MWTAQNRGRYDRSQLRYPSDLTDENGRMLNHLFRRASAAATSATSTCAK